MVVQVRKRNVSKSFPAQVLCIGLECDLAVLTVPSDEFWVGVHAIKLEDELVEVLPTFPFQPPFPYTQMHNLTYTRVLPSTHAHRFSLAHAPRCPMACCRVCGNQMGDVVDTVGFPRGGEKLCVTNGVVSRVDLSGYYLAIQIDAAINSGNSGGPVLNDKQACVGVAYKKLADARTDNISYIVRGTERLISQVARLGH